jgi:hypothetical protein
MSQDGFRTFGYDFRTFGYDFRANPSDLGGILLFVVTVFVYRTELKSKPTNRFRSLLCRSNFLRLSPFFPVKKCEKHPQFIKIKGVYQKNPLTLSVK